MLVPGPILLADTLLGGQAFRWRVTQAGAFEGVLSGVPVTLQPTPDGGAVARFARASGADAEAALAAYLRLDDDYDAQLTRLVRDPRLAASISWHKGLRLLRQDPWEALCAFIVSANNNVRRIEGIVERLAQRAGAPIEGSRRRAFPAPAAVARLRESTLRALGLGYRAPFLRATARVVASGGVDLARLRERATYEEAHAALLGLDGVGPKVADCVCLFALDKTEAFPVDRWVARVVAQAFGREAPARPEALAAWARERWGADAGLAQQFLFHGARTAGSQGRSAPLPL